MGKKRNNKTKEHTSLTRENLPELLSHPLFYPYAVNPVLEWYIQEKLHAHGKFRVYELYREELLSAVKGALQQAQPLEEILNTPLSSLPSWDRICDILRINSPATLTQVSEGIQASPPQQMVELLFDPHYQFRSTLTRELEKRNLSLEAFVHTLIKQHLEKSIEGKDVRLVFVRDYEDTPSDAIKNFEKVIVTAAIEKGESLPVQAFDLENRPLVLVGSRISREVENRMVLRGDRTRFQTLCTIIDERHGKRELDEREKVHRAYEALHKLRDVLATKERSSDARDLAVIERCRDEARECVTAALPAFENKSQHLLWRAESSSDPYRKTANDNRILAMQPTSPPIEIFVKTYDDPALAEMCSTVSQKLRQRGRREPRSLLYLEHNGRSMEFLEMFYGTSYFELLKAIEAKTAHAGRKTARRLTALRDQLFSVMLNRTVDTRYELQGVHPLVGSKRTSYTEVAANLLTPLKELYGLALSPEEEKAYLEGCRIFDERFVNATFVPRRDITPEHALLERVVEEREEGVLAVITQLRTEAKADDTPLSALVEDLTDFLDLDRIKLLAHPAEDGEVIISYSQVGAKNYEEWRRRHTYLWVSDELRGREERKTLKPGEQRAILKRLFRGGSFDQEKAQQHIDPNRLQKYLQDAELLAIPRDGRSSVIVLQRAARGHIQNRDEIKKYVIQELLCDPKYETARQQWIAALEDPSRLEYSLESIQDGPLTQQVKKATQTYHHHQQALAMEINDSRKYLELSITFAERAIAQQPDTAQHLIPILHVLRKAQAGKPDLERLYGKK